MDSLERFRRKMSYSGGSIRGEHLQDSRKLLREVFLDDASVMPNVYMWAPGKLGAESYINDRPLIIRFFDRKFSNANGWMVQFQTPFMIPILTGDILYDVDADMYLICTEVFDIDGVHWQGKLTQCNWILKWQKRDGTILEYPCADQNATQYNSGETANRQFTIGSSQHLLILPRDNNTVKLKTPQRFFLDNDFENPTAFIVTQNDTTSYAYGKKGLVRVTVFEDPLRPDVDRIDLGICDYIDPASIIEDNAQNVYVAKSVITYNTLVIKSGGDMQTFIGEFYDSDGNKVDDVNGKWKLVCDFEDSLEVDESNNQIRIGIDNDDYVDEEFKLVFSDENNKYSSYVIVKVDSLL